MSSPCRRIESGQRELARIRLRAGGFLVLLALLLGGIWELIYFRVDLQYFGKKASFWNTPWAYVFELFSACLYYGRLIVVTLAPVSHSVSIMRLAIGIDVAVVSIENIINALFVPWEPADLVAVLSANLFVDACFIVGCFSIACSTNLTSMRLGIWRLLGGWVGAHIPITASIASYFSSINHKVAVRWMWVPVQMATLLLILKSDWREGLRRRVNALIEAKSSRAAAAGVAAMVGNCKPREVMAQAASRFRCVRMDEVGFEDMTDNSPNHQLFSKTKHGKLGQCDAFISHSWHDDPQAKWEAIQRWRGDFVERFGQEPTAWIDKYCIDQQCIEQNLRCLPVFLSGCKNLVVFCGPTYLSRLWCIVELFTFVHMGGSVENIYFEPVCRSGFEQEDFETICASFNNFDAQQCTCYLQQDKERMLTVIAEAFGNMGSFNRAVRGIFDRSSWKEIAACAGGEASPFSPTIMRSVVRRQTTLRRPIAFSNEFSDFSSDTSKTGTSEESKIEEGEEDADLNLMRSGDDRDLEYCWCDTPVSVFLSHGNSPVGKRGRLAT
eukprot:CAMPEP_0176041584 /NCGR_PEP_ID=MMETSP0120_2-20121206/20627_1 /TAXON_ID=160619 /ORGANISM="Kryptoperidinium foliaceum, Strain CCMP 1326" /LENGTH=552 /DNA_ID=CAMNT_0017374987 /DNA_START=75 /DNA_END=1733 /DNA_ORIENTATION=+